LLRLILIDFLLLFLFNFGIYAQEKNYVFHHLTSKDGLGSEYVQSVFQDSKGIYWVGTTSGLQKFDGYTFSKPLTVGNDLLPSPFVTETKDGTIWISNGISSYRYDRINERFIPVKPEFNNPGMYLRVIEDSSGNIWALNDLALYKYDPPSGKLITWMKLPPYGQGMRSEGVVFNKNTNDIWIQIGPALYKISPLEKTIVKKTEIPRMAVSMWMDGNAYLWLGFWTTDLCRYNIQTGEKKCFTMPFHLKGSITTQQAIASCYARDESGKLWIGTIDGGLWYFDELSGKPEQVQIDNLKPESLHFNENIYSITIDNTGNIWVGTDKGLNIFNPSYQRFYTLDNTDLPTKGIPAFISQKPFETGAGDILIPTIYGGWLHYDNHFQLRHNFTGILNSKSSDIEKNKTMVTCFAEDKKGRIWVGHRGGLLGIYEPRTDAISYTEVPEFGKATISGILCDPAGNMWFVLTRADSNLVKWDNNLKRYKIYNDSLLTNKLQQQASIMITSQGGIWVESIGNGIYRFDPILEKIAEIYREEQLPGRIPTLVHEISPLNDSVIVVATYAKGFLFFNTFQKTTVPLGTLEGLPSNYSRALATDSRNNLWLAMLNDLVRMDPQTKKIISFGEEEGVLNKSFAFGFTKLRDGRLMITTNTGLLYFHPDSIKTQPPPPDVLITGLKIDNQPVLLDSILLADNHKIRLAYDKNFLTIDYVSISYLNRKTTQYFYKLDGLEKDWVKAGTQRFTSYTNLSPGKYTFMVRCENRDGVSSKNITYLTIIISPPWWLTWWAYTLYAVIFSTSAWLIYRTRIISLKKKQQDEIKAMVATQEEERKRISRDLHDDVGTKLSALKLFVSSLHDKAATINNEEIKSLAKSSEQFITEAMQDVRQLLLNLSPTVLEEFGYTTAVEGLVNKINETHLIKFTLVVFGMNNRLQKDYELVLYRVTQELINNVLKHAEAKNVSLQIGQRDKKIILMMEDDGKGFDLSAHKGGYGLQNLDARTKLMHGTMTIDSHPGKGTSVLIEIPYTIADL
jgi:signal transduction histidine kinase/ligand-binding sensor domain-containing protein